MLTCTNLPPPPSRTPPIAIKALQWARIRCWGLIAAIAVISGCGPQLEHDGNRLIRKASFTRIELSPNLTDSVYYHTNVYSDGTDLYVANYGRKRVDRYSVTGEFLNSVGLGNGRGPGEITGLGRIHVKNDTVWVVDRALVRASAFDKDGTFLFTMPLSGYPDDVVPLGDKLYVENNYREDVFSAVEIPTGTELLSFGRLVDDFREYLSSMEASWFGVDDTALLYVPVLSSFMYRFRPDGSIIDTLVLPDAQPLPKHITQASNAWATPAMPATYPAHYLSRDTLYTYTLLSGVDADGRENVPPFKRYFDFTSMESGYLFSVHADSARLPLRTIMGFAPGAVVGMGYDDQVQVWRIRLE